MKKIVILLIVLMFVAFAQTGDTSPSTDDNSNSAGFERVFKGKSVSITDSNGVKDSALRPRFKSNKQTDMAVVVGVILILVAVALGLYHYFNKMSEQTQVVRTKAAKKIAMKKKAVKRKRSPAKKKKPVAKKRKPAKRRYK